MTDDPLFASPAQLAAQTGHTESAIKQAIKHGHLPKPNAQGLLPYFEVKLILMSRKPGQHWVQGRERPGKRKQKQSTDKAPDISDSDTLKWEQLV
jgi:hypothetical protein